MSDSALEAFMQLKGIDANFVDAWGNDAIVDDENIKGIIEKMGFDASDEVALGTHYQQEEMQHWLSLLAPVTVLQQSSNYQIEVHLPIDFVTDPLIYRVITEDGQTIDNNIIAIDFPLLGCNEISDVEFQLYCVDLAIELAVGYHRLILLEKGNDTPLAEMSLIITPSACYTPKSIAEGKKLWGTSVQLYGLKSATNWGIGDFSDLKILLRKVAENGGDFIGLNPIHALSPAQPQNASPYSPSSRKWLNILYTDITVVAEFEHCLSLQKTFSSDTFQTDLNLLRDTQWVDYERVTLLKINALSALFVTLNDGKKSNKKRLASFMAFVVEKGDSLKQQAAYDALQFEFLKQDKQVQNQLIWAVI